jgi:hypothetical protein
MSCYGYVDKHDGDWGLSDTVYGQVKWSYLLVVPFSLKEPPFVISDGIDENAWQELPKNWFLV